MSLKCAYGQAEVVQLGDVSRGFGHHTDGQKVIVINLEVILAHKIQVFYHKRQLSGFPCATLYINSEVAIQRC